MTWSTKLIKWLTWCSMVHNLKLILISWFYKCDPIDLEPFFLSNNPCFIPVPSLIYHIIQLFYYCKFYLRWIAFNLEFEPIVSFPGTLEFDVFCLCASIWDFLGSNPSSQNPSTKVKYLKDKTRPSPWLRTISHKLQVCFNGFFKLAKSNITWFHAWVETLVN